MNFEKKCVLLVLIISLFARMIVPCSSEGFVENKGEGRDVSGECGAGVRWKYESKNDVLKISGDGEMDDFSSLFPAPFAEHRNYVKQVFIEMGVTSIGSYAFYDFSKLSSITIADSVTSIGSSAFQGCIKLTSIELPDSVTFIGSHAFFFCSGLQSINIPSHITSIESNTFYGCIGITSIYIPNSVTSIGSDAFSACTELSSINIPNSVTSIGSNAFKDCSKITSMSIPESVSSIGPKAFDGCNIRTYECKNGACYLGNEGNKYHALIKKEDKSVASCIVNNGTFLIAGGAFEGCTGLASINIPNSVTSIGSQAFSACGGLSSINIPNSVTSIGSNAFKDCSKLTSIYIPESVSSIGDDAFSGCNHLKSVFYPGTTFISNTIFNNDNTAPQNICVSTYYNYSSFGGKPVTSSEPNCTLFQSMFNKCYTGAYIDNELTGSKRKEFIDFEKQRTGCVERTCDNDIGLVAWSVCNSTKRETLVCMKDKCLEYKSLMKDKVRVEIELEAEILSVTMNTTVILNQLDGVGIETNALNVAYETNAEGYFVRVIMYVNDEKEANSIAYRIKSLCT